MPSIARTKWAKAAICAMTMKEITTKELAAAIGHTREYTSSVIYGQVDRPAIKKVISKYLGISPDIE